MILKVLTPALTPKFLSSLMNASSVERLFFERIPLITIDRLLFENTSMNLFRNQLSLQLLPSDLISTDFRVFVF